MDLILDVLLGIAIVAALIASHALLYVMGRSDGANAMADAIWQHKMEELNDQDH